MIINYPTGLYGDTSKTTSLTYDISLNKPPRSRLAFVKIPIGIEIKKKTKSQAATNEKYGFLIYSTVSSRRSDAGSNSRQYEIGQILTFVDNPVKAADPMLVSQNTTVQHNTNSPNYSIMGLNDDDIDIINKSAAVTYSDLSAKLAEYKNSRYNSEVSINEYTKAINEINRTSSALLNIGGSDIASIIDKLNVKLNEYSNLLNAAISDSNMFAQLASETVDKIRELSTVVK